MHFVVFVLDDEDMQETAAEKAADRIERKEGVSDLDDDRGRHRDSEGEDHLVAPADRAFRAQQLEQRHDRVERVEGDQQRERQLAQRTGLVHALGVDGEEDAGKAVHDQPDCEERHQSAPRPQQVRAQTAVHLQVGGDEARPGIDGQRHRHEEDNRVGVEETTPFQMRKHPPQDIPHEEKQQADEKVSELSRPRARIDVPPIDQVLPVDDQMNNQRDAGDARIEVI